MPFPPEFLRELNDRNRIEDIAASYVNLRRRGKNLVGLCPFHNEKTPSFCVYPENNSFFCFGCNKGGDVITFIMGVENLDFTEAVRFLAQRAGLSLPEEGAEILQIGNNSFSAEAARSVIRASLDILCEEISDCIDKSGYIIPEYVPVTLTGGGISYIRGAKEHVSGRIGMVVEEVAPKIPLGFKPTEASLYSLLDLTLG